MSNIPRTLTAHEEKAILRTTLPSLRDHMIILLALKTGLRQHEILALNVGDVYTPEGTVRRAVQLHTFKRSNEDTTAQCIFLTHDSLRDKLAKWRRAKIHNSESLDPAAPLFVSREGTRLSERQVRTRWAQWQVAAGFDRPVRFHDLRHTACTRYYDLCGNKPAAVQKFARHKNRASTAIYEHVSDEFQAEMVRRL